MTHSIPIRSLMTTLTYTVLILTLAGCGPGFDDGSDRAPREPSEIEIRYFEMRAEREERLRTHTGEGPVFTDEEQAEFKRMEQDYYAQLEIEKVERYIEKKQKRLKETYEFCEKGHQGNCRDIFKADVEDVDEDERRKTIQTRAYLPNTIIAEYYFGLQGEGCASDDPVNTWTDVEAVTIQYTGDGDVPPFGDYRFGRWGVRLAECDASVAFRTPDIFLELHKDVDFEFKVTPGFKDVQSACSQEEPYRCGGMLALKADFYGRWVVEISNGLPHNLSYESYFDVAGTGCYTDDKIQEWTGDNIVSTVVSVFNHGIAIKHKGNLVDPRKTEDYVVAECEVSAQVRVVGEKPVFIPQLHRWSSKRSRMETPGTVIVPFTIAPE